MLVVWRHTVCPAKFALLRYCWDSSACQSVFPNRPVMNVPLLKAYSVNNFTNWLLKWAPKSAIMRARARPHTLAPPGLLPLTESGGEETRGALVLCG